EGTDRTGRGSASVNHCAAIVIGSVERRHGAGSMGHLSVAHMSRVSIRSSDPPTAIEDAWGRPVPDRETDDDEAERLLMPLNWLCDLLERMGRAPERAAGPDGVAFNALMRRLRDSCRSKLVRDQL